MKTVPDEYDAKVTSILLNTIRASALYANTSCRYTNGDKKVHCQEPENTALTQLIEKSLAKLLK